ncbi:MAG: hypothetical protein ACRDLA_01585 [Thermoleophilaceae bacterium]
MSSVTSHISMSLDGFVAGPNQSLEDPLGEGGQFQLWKPVQATRRGMGFRDSTPFTLELPD